MKQIAIAPPPLPPKMRRSPPERTTTVLADSQDNHHHHQSHVVKIRINPMKSEIASVTCDVAPRISISVNSEGDMIQKSNAMEVEGERNPYFFFGSYNCNVMSSGQVSPSDTLDSGTCSDLDGTPPPLPKKKGNGITVTVINGHHKRVTSSTSSGVDLDSDDNESSISYDSLNSGELHQDAAVVSLANAVAATTIKPQESSGGGFPQGLLQDIRQRNVKLSPTETVLKNSVETTNAKTSSPTATIIVDESTYVERKEKEKQDMCVSSLTYDTDCYYNFHLNENQEDEEVAPVTLNENETFAGYKDLLSDGSSTIRSAKGTVRGVKNRVRAGIATFLQINSVTKNYRDSGKVVVYTTTMGILRDTYQACTKVKQILRTLLVKYEERDVFMSSEYQAEIRERMRCDCILVPQVFVDGQHVGDVETIERLNETGELRRILKPYKSMDVCTTCKMCGGYRLLPCTICNGSKKSVHRNHFTAEFVALKCMNCDEVGLIRCNACS